MEPKEEEIKKMRISFEYYLRTTLFCAHYHPGFSVESLDGVVKEFKNHINNLNHGK